MPEHIVSAAHAVLLARTWHGWDGRPIERIDEEGGPGTRTPYKALRQIADRLLD
jgi:hypothetical protein